jgi:hypothetical protein
MRQHNPNITVEDYIEFLIDAIPRMEGDERTFFTDHFLDVVGQLDHIENCYQLEAYEPV